MDNIEENSHDHDQMPKSAKPNKYIYIPLLLFSLPYFAIALISAIKITILVVQDISGPQLMIKNREDLGLAFVILLIVSIPSAACAFKAAFLANVAIKKIDYHNPMRAIAIVSWIINLILAIILSFMTIIFIILLFL